MLGRCKLPNEPNPISEHQPKPEAPVTPHVRVNIIAIAQGSSELTIALVVRRDGLERAVRAVHAECGLGRRPPVPVFPFSPPKRRGGRTGQGGLS
jgi:hypothetical protein